MIVIRETKCMTVRVAAWLAVSLTFFMTAGSVAATEQETAVRAHCRSEWGSSPEHFTKCLENQELAKARYRERLARGLAYGDASEVRVCRDLTIDHALDRGLDPSGMNWFVFEDCFLANKYSGFRMLVAEWEGVNRDALRFECAAPFADQMDEFYARWVPESPEPTSFFREFDDCYFRAVATMLGYKTDCGKWNGEPFDPNSNGCIYPWSFPPIGPTLSDAEIEEIREHVRRRKCEFRLGSKAELAKICPQERSDSD